jgi:hypothetical protein
MKHWYDMVETGHKEYPKYMLTHFNGSKRYMIMVLAWDVDKNVARGWFNQAEFDTIKECREYMKKF